VGQILIVAPNLRKEKIMAEKTAKTSTKTTAKKAAPKAATGPSKAAAKAPLPKLAKPAAAAKKPAATAKPAASKSTAAKTAPKAAKKTMMVSDEQRYRMIAEAAYYRAESNQFKSDPVRDWIEAESDIAALLSGSK
jgi:hypothetical protein